MILSVTIQLALFFIVASAGLWLDQLINGVASQITKNEMLYKVMTALVLAVSSFPHQSWVVTNDDFSY